MSLISVVIATYNRAAIVLEATRSILHQTHSNLELILVDDCSTDNTGSVLKSLMQEDDRVKYLTTRRNSGCNIARNMGIEQAQGDYIAILDDDDIALPDRLAKQMDLMNLNPSVGLVASQILYFDRNRKPLFPYPSKRTIRSFPTDPRKVFEDIYLGKYFIPNPAIMVRAEILKEIKYPGFALGGADKALQLQLSAIGVKFHIIPEVLVLMRRDPKIKQMTSSVHLMQDGRMERNRFIRGWLLDKGITEFDHLHVTAEKNSYTNFVMDQAGSKGILSGFFVYALALINNPSFSFYLTRLLFEQAYLKLAGRFLNLYGKLMN